MDQAITMDDIKERFIDTWRTTFAYLSLIIIFDLLVQLMSGIFTLDHTLKTTIAVALLATAITALLTLTLPLLRFLSDHFVQLAIAVAGLVAMYVYFGWWGAGGAGFIILLMLTASRNGSGEAGGSRGSSSSVDDDYSAEQKRHDEWNNSHEKRARDYDQLDKG